jgi:hypothetical protein
MSWFASPDHHLGSETGLFCIYEVNCEVTVNGQIFRDQSPPWQIVNVQGMSPGRPEVFGETAWPRFTNWSTIVVDRRMVGGAPEWYVNGQGSFRRRNSRITIFLPPGSQFVQKTLVHENKHAYQLDVDPRWAQTFDANDLYQNVLINLTSNVSEADLRREIMAAVQNRHDDDRMTLELARQDSELEAYAADRAVAPHYLETSDDEVRQMYP